MNERLTAAQQELGQRLIFREQDPTGLPDRRDSEIFHEISILREEHTNVKDHALPHERGSPGLSLGGKDKD
jgi:hypothetical protein